jgi:hypothetical protein
MKTCIAVILLILLGSCATPIGPAGGLPDKQGLAIVATWPESGATSFSGKKVVFLFDDFPDRTTLASAVRVMPQGIRFTVVPGRKSATVVFTDALPEETTVQVVLSGNAADYKRNAAGKSSTIAFSTGPVIDKGVVTGRIIMAGPVSLTQGVVGLWKPEDSLFARPRYLVQPDTSGSFLLNHVKEASYRVLFFADKNKNLIFERNESFYSGGETGIFEADTAQNKAGMSLIVPVFPDSVKPEVLGIGVLSRERLRLRLNKPVPDSIVFPFQITFRDTVSGMRDTAIALYATDEPSILAQSLKPWKNNAAYQIDKLEWLKGEPENELFYGVSSADTARFVPVAILNGKNHLSTEPLKVLYSKVDALFNPADSVKIFANESPVQAISKSRHLNQIEVIPAGGWKRGTSYEVRLFIPASRGFLRHKVELLFPDDEGGISLARDSARVEPLRYRLFNRETKHWNSGSLSGDNTIPAFPGTYWLMVYHDSNGNGVWDAARAHPFLPAERVSVHRSVSVKRAFITEIQPEFSR